MGLDHALSFESWNWAKFGTAVGIGAITGGAGGGVGHSLVSAGEPGMGELALFGIETAVTTELAIVLDLDGIRALFPRH